MPPDWQAGQTKLNLTVQRGGEEIDLGPFVPRTIGVQPTQLYESLSMFLVMLVLLAFDGVRHREGQGMALLMICYGLHRSINEMLRIDQRPVGFEHYVSVLLIAGGIVMMLWLALRRAGGVNPPVTEPGGLTPPAPPTTQR
jgi:prolipoprotein diacylglyceryltransferase